MPPESRTSRTLLRRSSRQTMGTSATRYPSRRASHSTSASKPNPSRRCRPKSSCAADRRKALNPHWLSRMPGSSRSETSPLKVRPASSRSQGWLDLDVGRGETPGSDRHVRPPGQRRAKLARLVDGRRQVHVREQHVTEARGEHAAPNRRALARFRSLRRTVTSPRPGSAERRDVGGAVGAPVVHDDDLHGLVETARVLDHPGQRDRQPTGLVVGRHDDREPRSVAAASVVLLRLHGLSARLPAPIGRARHDHHARAPSVGA